jgi:catechol 2,3-dioxygenase-like lactoylglutathione lyase family enzyme
MDVSRVSIYLTVGDASQSSAFYEALLGAPPTSSNASTVVFEFDAPALLLTLEARAATRGTKRSPNSPRAAQHGGRSESAAHNRFSLVVPEPEHVGRTAIALRRAGVRLRLQDQGLEARDPDGNEWRVRFVPSTQGRAIVEIPMEQER